MAPPGWTVTPGGSPEPDQLSGASPPAAWSGTLTEVLTRVLPICGLAMTGGRGGDSSRPPPNTASSVRRSISNALRYEQVPLGQARSGQVTAITTRNSAAPSVIG